MPAARPPHSMRHSAGLELGGGAIPPDGRGPRGWNNGGHPEWRAAVFGWAGATELAAPTAQRPPARTAAAASARRAEAAWARPPRGTESAAGEAPRPPARTARSGTPGAAPLRPAAQTSVQTESPAGAQPDLAHQPHAILRRPRRAEPWRRRRICHPPLQPSCPARHHPHTGSAARLIPRSPRWTAPHPRRCGTMPHPPRANAEAFA